MPRRTDGLETKHKILKAASELFAERGFARTTNADIAKKSGLNSALISYYFGDKETIYVEGWRYSREKSAQRWPLDGGVSPDASATDRLCGTLSATIRKNLDRGCLETGILYQEIASPTGLLRDIHSETIRELRERLLSLVREILFPVEIPPDELRNTVLSLIALCLVPLDRIQYLEKCTPYPYDTETRIRHIHGLAKTLLNEQRIAGNRATKCNHVPSDSAEL